MGSNTGRTSSLIERLDPRTKFFSFLVLALQIFGLHSDASLISASVFLAGATVFARIPLLLLLKRTVSISLFLVLILVLHAFTASGEVVFQFMGVYATEEGLIRGAGLSVRLILLLIAATVFGQTTSISSMVDGIDAVLGPFKKRLGGATQVLTIATNFVPMLIRSARQIKVAQQARGAEPDRNIIRQLRFAISSAIPLFAMSLRSSENLALAMESRCYHPLEPRSRYIQLHFASQDWWVSGLVCAQCVLTAALAS
jgi:energy-coupling factor transport system permease protein